MAVQFTENHQKEWIFFKGKYLNAEEDSPMLLSDDTKKILKDCINACADNNQCQWFSWSTEGGHCRQYKFLENGDSTFQWRYDFYKYQGLELPEEVFNLSHTTETQEQCMNDCYNDTNCVGVNYLDSVKSCRIFYNYSNENTYFGYYAVNQNEAPVGGDPTTTGDEIYDTEAKIEKHSISFGTIIGILLAIAFIIFIVYMFVKYRKNNKNKKQPPPLPPRY